MSATPTDPLADPERVSALAPIPQQGAVDYFAQIVQLGISAIPDWGGAAAQLFGMIAAPLLGQRRDAWFEELRAQMNELSRKVDGLTIQALAHNEQFVSATLQAIPQFCGQINKKKEKPFEMWSLTSLLVMHLNRTYSRYFSTWSTSSLLPISRPSDYLRTLTWISVHDWQPNWI